MNKKDKQAELAKTFFMTTGLPYHFAIKVAKKSLAGKIQEVLPKILSFPGVKSQKHVVGNMQSYVCQYKGRTFIVEV